MKPVIAKTNCMKLSFLVLLTLLSVASFSQCDFNTTAGKDISLDSLTFTRLIENQYSKLVNGDSKTKPGNFAGLDIKEGQVTFNASKIFSKMRVLNLNATGSIDGSTYAIFNNSKINSNISLEVKFSWLPEKNRKLRTYECEVLKRDMALKRIDSVFKISKSLFSNKRKYLAALLEDYTAKKDNPPPGIALSPGEIDVKIDSLKIIILREYTDTLARFAEIKKQYAKERKAAELDINITGYSMNWWSVGYKVANKTFSRIDPAVPADKQITKENYTAHYIVLEWNKMKWSNQPGESHYLQFGADGFLNDNKDQLKRLEITETNEFSPAPSSRTTTKKYFAYQGTYAKELLGVRLHIDYYKFLFKDNLCAFHFYPDAVFMSKSEPLYNIGIGFMYSFKDKKDEKEKALINAELYLTLKDLGNAKNLDKSALERNEVGIRFGLPLKFF